MRIIPAYDIEKTVARLVIEANISLPRDVRDALRSAVVDEPWETARGILQTLNDNAELAEKLRIPVCQDTGMACVFLELGRNVHIEGDIIAAVNSGVARGYEDGFLRKSIVADPLRRTNTGDNTPAAVYVDYTNEHIADAVKITVAPKGFGSENMSRIKMLRPSDGVAGVMDFVVETVELAGGNPCPPIIVGVGVGANFDKVALLAKRALLRPINERNADPFYASMERELLLRINALGIGPQGLGGKTTALGVNVLAAPTHIAGLPVAVNVSCHVTRHITEVI